MLLIQIRRVMYALLIVAIAGLVSLTRVSASSSLSITPSSPQLGDTISVTIPASALAVSDPKIKAGSEVYTMYPVSGDRFRALVPTTPLSKPGSLTLQLVQGTETSNSQTVSLRNRTFPVQRIWLPPGKDDLGTDYEFDTVAAFKKTETPKKMWSGAFLRPNGGGVTSEYGVRRYYNGVFAQDYFHRGVDYGGGVGSPVVAPADGRVALVGRESQGFEVHGNIIGLDHGEGVTSAYLHLSRINVKEGDLVKAGQVIGAVGNTGAITGPHLHWGLYVHGESVDPVPWRYDGIE